MSTSSRHSECPCHIVPPHILEALAQNGAPAERQLALATLAQDERQRIVRDATRAVARSIPVAAAAGPSKSRVISDCKSTTTLPGTKVRSEGQASTGDVAVDEAYDGLGATFDLYWNIYQRNSGSSSKGGEA